MRIFLFLSLFCTVAFSYPMTPDKGTTPGSLCTDDDPHFEEYRYAEQIPYCRRSVGKSRKNYVYELYDIPSNERRSYTIDHMVPLSIGGSNHVNNLWPEHKDVKKLRPNLEYQVFLALKRGQINQYQALQMIYRAKFCPQCRAELSDELKEMEEYYEENFEEEEFFDFFLEFEGKLVAESFSH